MRKILNWIFIAVLSLTSVFVLTSCGKKTKNAADLLQSLVIEQDNKIVNSDFTIPAQISISDKEVYELKWTSNNSYAQIGETKDNNGNFIVSVTRPETTQEVTLTVELTISKKNSASKDFTIRITPIDVYDFVDEFSEKVIFVQNGTNVNADFDLVTSYTLEGYPTETATIAWESRNEELVAISDDGKKALVTPTDVETKVVLIATFTYKNESSSSTFSVKVSSPMSDFEKLQYWYSNTGITQTLSGYVVCIGAEYSESYGNISLYMIDDTLQGGYYLYRVKTTVDEAAQITLGCHVTATGTTNSNYRGLMETNAGGNLVVDEDVTPIDVNTTVYAMDNDIIANAQSLYYRLSTLVSLTNWKVTEVTSTPLSSGTNATAMVVEKDGVRVTIRYSKYIQDTLGDEAVAALNSMLSNFSVGDYVNINGLLSYHNEDSIQYNQNSYQINLTGPNSVTAGTADNAATVGKAVGEAIASFEGFGESYTERTEINLPTELNGVSISWAIPESCTLVTSSAELTNNKLTLTPGNKTESITVIATYTKGNYSTSVYYKFVTEALTDKQIADKAVEEVTVDEQTVAGVVTLPTSSSIFANATFTYALKGTYTSVTLDKNKLTVKLPATDEEVTLIVTATVGDESSEKEVTFTVKAIVITPIADFIAAGNKTDTFMLQGVVTAVNTLDGKGSFILTDSTGSIFCYDKVLNVAEGDEIKVTGKLSLFSNVFPQLSSPVLVEEVSTGNDVVEKSGAVVAFTAAEISADISNALTDAELVNKYVGKYLEITGYIIKSGSYYGVAVNSTDTSYVINLYANSGIDLASLEGQEVVVRGFSRGVSSGRNITVQLQSAKANSASE